MHATAFLETIGNSGFALASEQSGGDTKIAQDGPEDF